LRLRYWENGCFARFITELLFNGKNCFSSSTLSCIIDRRDTSEENTNASQH
jgi:hypothetical protein